MDHYRSGAWKAFREEVIRLDGGICLSCGRGRADGVILSVHHKQYLPGHKPWEYPYDLCETMCTGCHAAKHGLIAPKFGWQLCGWDDLEDLVGECELCGQAIRYVFLVDHPDWYPLEVGEECCDNLTSTQVASGLMESKRRYSARVKRFASSSRWSVVKEVHSIRQKRLRLEVVPSEGQFRLRIEGTLGRKLFATVIDAKIAAFEVIDSGAASTYLEKHKKKARPPFAWRFPPG